MKKNPVHINRTFLHFTIAVSLFTSCSVQKQIDRSAKASLLQAKALQTAHIGISIYDPEKKEYLYNHQGDHYFVPASNTKIPTCYAAMKYLGDSLVGLRYKIFDQVEPSVMMITETGDPTFLHADFKNQPVYEFLKSQNISILRLEKDFLETRLGSGWAWSDFEENYMAERSAMPIYGNVVRIINSNNKIEVTPRYFLDVDSIGSLSEFLKELPYDSFTVIRDYERNHFDWKMSNQKFKSQEIPFITGQYTIRSLLYDTLGVRTTNRYSRKVLSDLNNTIHSQPTDSVLKPMMHRSDNFFAEQLLLMVSNEMLGVMSDEKIIDTLLKTDFKDLPQKPRWVDGCGLSRYNLFTPQDFVAILNKMKNEFGMERIKAIFPTGGEGTISSYYKTEPGFIYGKTGTLSGVVAFSGFLYTKKGKLLLFSTLVNNHNGSATEVRRAVEKFLQSIRNRY